MRLFIGLLGFILMSITMVPYSNAQSKVLFLHHSTGRNLLSEGNVIEWFAKFNESSSWKVEFVERTYPAKPYAWKNYPFDYWNLWVNGKCDSKEPGIECLATLSSEYDAIVFKHCYPAAGILEDEKPSIYSERKSLENYKLQYRALRDMMDKKQDTLFIIWTLVPLHRLATNVEGATRAGEFVRWVKNDYLKEDNKAHPNIKIFDYWGIVAETGPASPKGMLNCLKYDFERNHASPDSHPNSLANATAGPLFAKFVVDAVDSFNARGAVPKKLL